MNERTELKPCPFCGGQADLWWKHSRIGYFTVVVCSICKSSGKIFSFDDELPNEWESSIEAKRAKQAWNRRKNDDQC